MYATLDYIENNMSATVRVINNERDSEITIVVLNNELDTNDLAFLVSYALKNELNLYVELDSNSFVETVLVARLIIE